MTASAITAAVANPKPAPSTTRALVSEATVELHTTQAQSLWDGLRTAPNAIGVRPPGAVDTNLVSAALRYAYQETGNDQPFADWTLIRFSQAMTVLEETCTQRMAGIQAVFDKYRATGVRVELATRPVVPVRQLTIHTPYHGRLVRTFALYDQAIRHYLTLEQSGAATRTQTRDTTNALRNLLASAMEGIVRETSTMRRITVPLTRAVLRSQPVDSDAAREAKASVDAAVRSLTKRFGSELPEEILTGISKPEHYRRVRSTGAQS
jgi:hypothetical protein